MRIVKVGVLAPTNKGIPLGVQGENLATEVEFDTRPWFREYPSGTVSAVARRNGDPAPYPLALDVEDGTAVWKVSDTDTAKAGEGAVELTMTSAGTRVRSLTFKTLVTASLTDAPVDDDAWYGWLDKAVVKVDETVQSAQRKMTEVDAEWTGLKADVTAKVDECSEAASQAASDAHHAKVDAQATAKALESAEGSVAKAEAAATRAEGAAEQAYGAAGQAEGWADRAENSATRAAASEANAALSASSAADSAEHATAQKVAAENAKDAAESFKAGAEAAKGEAAASAGNAAASATAAAKSASDAAASVDAINVISPKHTGIPPSQENGLAIGANAVSKGTWAVAIGNYSYAEGPGATAIGSQSRATNGFSTAAVNGATTSRNREFSVGSPEYTSYVANVTTPSFGSDASTKKYTDDNDAKTLSEAKKYTDDNDAKTLVEAKKYTDDNTSNALVGNVSGKLLHVEDAWPGKPLSMTIDGAYKQDGTPSPESPAPIMVVENPTLKVTGADTSAAVTSLPITLPAEHPYLAALPDGTHDEIVIDKDGNASLVAKVKATTTDDINKADNYEEKAGGADFQIRLNGNFKYGIDLAASNVCIDGDVNQGEPVNGGVIKGDYVRMTKPEKVTDINSAKEYLIELGFIAYGAYVTPVTHQLGKLDIPALPETISNVWIEANLTPKCAMTYKQDVNVVIADLNAQIAELKGTPSNDSSDASQPDATVVIDNGVN